MWEIVYIKAISSFLALKLIKIIFLKFNKQNYGNNEWPSSKVLRLSTLFLEMNYKMWHLLVTKYPCALHISQSLTNRAEPCNWFWLMHHEWKWPVCHFTAEIFKSQWENPPALCFPVVVTVEVQCSRYASWATGWSSFLH